MKVRAMVKFEVEIAIVGERDVVTSALLIRDRFRGRPVDWMAGRLNDGSWDITDAERKMVADLMPSRTAGEVQIGVSSVTEHWTDAEFDTVEEGRGEEIQGGVVPKGV